MSVTVLVTGCAGFIGSNLCSYLAVHRPDWRVVGVESPERRDLRAIGGLLEDERIGFYRTDLQNELELKRIFWSQRPDVVINLARNPQNPVGCDILGARNLFLAASDVRCKKFFHLSSPGVGAREGTRAAGEVLLWGLAQEQKHTELYLLHTARVFGCFEPSDRFVASTILSALTHKGELGSEGEPEEWLVVSELCRALVGLVEAPEGKDRLHRLDIAGYSPMTEGEVASMIGAILQRRAVVPGEVRVGMRDPTGLSQRTGFCLQGTMQGAMEQVVRWFVRNRWWWEASIRESQAPDQLSLR